MTDKSTKNGAFPGYTTEALRKRADDLAFQMHLTISPITFHAERKLVEQMRAEIARRNASKRRT